jgi:prephenate dehydrogenase
MDFSSITIVGPGLLGGSIALAAAKRGYRGELRVWGRREEAVREVEAAGAVSLATTDLSKAVSGAELVVLCTPIGTMRDLAERLAGAIAPRAVVTDVGSVKRPVVEALEAVFGPTGRFVGSHPMAGAELAGFGSSRADLFEGATAIVTPTERTDPETLETVRCFWEWLGCRVREIDPTGHDEAVALVSHLPHLLAAALVDIVCEQDPNSLDFCGNGFKDTTRIASGPPAMWAEILRANRGPVRQSLQAILRKIELFGRCLDERDGASLESLLQKAKTGRDRLRSDCRNG